MASPNEIALDCKELQRLLTLTSRETIKNLLSNQIKELQRSVEDEKKESVPNEKGDNQPTSDNTPAAQTPALAPEPSPATEPMPAPKPSPAHDPSPAPTAKVTLKPSESQKILVPKLPTKTITSYGWDQSPKFVKVYITLNGVHSLAKDDISVEFSSSSMTLKVRQKACLHQLVVNSLLHQVIPDKSHYKVKTDNLVILLKKTAEKNWTYLTKTEEKAKQKSKPAAAPKPETSDPSAGVMGLMKQMYDDGDDDMKRTIAQAWTQARDKKDTVDFP